MTQREDDTARWRRKYERERKARLEAEAAAERAARDALYDPLTGLANRALFMDRATHALAKSKRCGMSMALVLLDIDGFKEINDSSGHEVGDELLRNVARRLRDSFRAADTASRLGGDEFALLIEGVGAAQRSALAERVRDVFARPFEVHGQPRAVTCSVGIALSQGCSSASELLQRADMAVDAAKRDGKSGYALYESSMRKTLMLRLEMRSDLERALENEEFLLHYQPLVDIPSGRAIGMEALVRWNRPRVGLVSPLEFLPLAEEIGLIEPIGWWVLEESCRQLARWRELHASAREQCLHVNVSTRQLRDPEAVAKVERALGAAAVPPRNLVLELTESGVMHDMEMSLDAMRVVRELGVRVAIDDFGTGYSSLSYLQKLPVDVLKIDKSFTDPLGTSESADALVSAIVNIASALGLEVVAEGVENAEQARRLAALDCRIAQGYYFSRPLDAVSMGRFLAAKRVPSARATEAPALASGKR